MDVHEPNDPDATASKSPFAISSAASTFDPNEPKPSATANAIRSSRADQTAKRQSDLQRRLIE
jgi:hypothetical protein